MDRFEAGARFQVKTLTKFPKAVTNFPKIVTKPPKIVTNLLKTFKKNIVTRFLNKIQVYGSHKKGGAWTCWTSMPSWQVSALSSVQHPTPHFEHECGQTIQRTTGTKNATHSKLLLVTSSLLHCAFAIATPSVLLVSWFVSFIFDCMIGPRESKQGTFIPFLGLTSWIFQVNCEVVLPDKNAVRERRASLLTTS